MRQYECGNATVERGVSPVIGVVLMIVLAVSLTVVVGGFASDLVDQAAVETPPDATIDVYNDEGTDDVRIAHDGGEDLDWSDVTVVVREVNGGEIDANVVDSTAPASELTTGDTVRVNSSEFSTGTEYEVLVVDDVSGKVVDDGVLEYEA